MRIQKNIILIMALLTILISCSNVSPLNPIGYLQPPLGLSAQATDDSIVLTFYSANNEKDFDGFNVYISETNNVAATAQGSQPLIPEGITPTIRSDFSDFNTNKVRTYEVKYKDSSASPLSKGVRYYFIVRAHSSSNRVSDPSNEASALIPE